MLLNRKMNPTRFILQFLGTLLNIDYSIHEENILFDILKDTLGEIVDLFSPLSADVLVNLLCFRKENVVGTLEDLHSILDVPENTSITIRLHHRSFRDFILDPEMCSD